jgi:hypothetical protein
MARPALSGYPKIWLSGRMSSDQIYYYEGNMDIAGDSAFNEYITVEDDGYALFLRLSNPYG